MWEMPEPDELIRRNETTINCDTIKSREKQPRKEIIQDSSSPHDIQTRSLDKTLSHLEMELAAARVAQESLLNGAPLSEEFGSRVSEKSGKSKYFMVIGINTAFNSRKRPDFDQNLG